MSKDSVEVRCPICGETVKVPRDKAERDMKVRCKNGHDIPLAKAF